MLKCIDYEFEVARFYDWLENNPKLNASAISLWYALMDTWRKAGYSDMITVAMSTLEAKSRLKSTAIKDARNKLAQIGRIEWHSRGGNQAAAYKIVSFGLLRPLSDRKDTRNADHKSVYNCSHSSALLINSNIDNKNNVINNSPLNDCGSGHSNLLHNIQQYYEKNTSNMLSPTAVLEIIEFLNIGVEDALICRAIDASIDAGARNWPYARKTVNGCVAKGILTLAKYKLSEADREALRTHKNRERSDGNGYEGDIF